jgi:hypothetical protein
MVAGLWQRAKSAAMRMRPLTTREGAELEFRIHRESIGSEDRAMRER